MMRHISQTSIFLLSISICISCSHAKPPTVAVSKAEVEVRQAEQPDAMNAAPLDVRKAREKLDQAKKEMDDKNYSKARRLAEEAMVDAQVAQSKANAAKTKRAADDGTKTIEILRQETDRATDEPESLVQ